MSLRLFHATAAPPWTFDLNPRRDAALDFPFSEYGTLTPADYATIGFICGLEIHQQLLTDTKLFCRCPAGRRMGKVDGEVLRHMRPTLSELGQYDGCALMEFKTRKEIVYLLDRRCVCTYELDDTPPFEIDEQALKIAIEVARLHDMALVSELQVMRKQYLDGSIPTGFQRTAVVAVGGSIPFPTSELGPGQSIGLRQLTIEEDSCREVSDVGHRIVFKTDRLGMPLIETVTDPDFLTPLDVAAGGRLLSSITRASGKVRRGPGAARQDVNVSIAGGRRVELKGVAHHRGLPLLVHVEAFRQLELLKIKHELEQRGVTKEMFAIGRDRPAWESDLAVDAQFALKRSEYPPVREALERDELIVAVKLPGFGGLLGRITQPGVPFAHEFAERVRVVACLASHPFMIGSHIQDYALLPGDWRKIRVALKGSSGDAFIVLWGPVEDMETAVREILLRAQDALDGVPPETRQTLPGGITGLERILPGPDRMYPDTDTPPKPIPDAWVDTIEASLPERPWDRSARYAQAGLDPHAAARLAIAPWADLFDALDPQTPVAARRLASGLQKRLVHHWRQSRARVLPNTQHLAPLVRAVESGALRPEAFEAVLDVLLRDPWVEPGAVVADFCPTEGDEERLERRVAEVAARLLREVPDGDPAALMRRALGLVMPGFLGRLDPPAVHAALRAALGNEESAA